MTLFLSDLHLGSPLCQADKLSYFLARNTHHHTIYLVGDVIDDVALWPWPAAHIEAIELLQEFGKIVWLPGNHDAAMRQLIGMMGRQIVVEDQGFYIANSGKRYFLTHGDRYDWTMTVTPPAWMRRPFKPRVSSGWHGRFFGTQIERKIVAAARELNCDGVICGHTHVPAHDKRDGVEYINCGDWMSHCTAVVDDYRGLNLVEA